MENMNILENMNEVVEVGEEIVKNAPKFGFGKGVVIGFVTAGAGYGLYKGGQKLIDAYKTKKAAKESDSKEVKVYEIVDGEDVE